MSMTSSNEGNGYKLDGHKLLMVSPFQIPQMYIDHLHRNYPGLDVNWVFWDSLRQQGLPPDLSEEEWKNITILVTGYDYPEPEAVPNLKLIQLVSAGSNYIVDKRIFKDTDITVCGANGIHAAPVAEWVFSTYLAFQHCTQHYVDAMKEGKWGGGALPRYEDAAGQRIGILGYGAVGRQVARVATAVGMEVYTYTNRARETPESRHDIRFRLSGLGDAEGTFPAKWFSHEKSELTDFLSSGLDLLVVCLPETPLTQGLLSKDMFKLMANKKTYLSNCSRGPVVNTDDLMTALDEGWIRGAALDVTDPEPLPPDHPLWHKKNVTITPHVSSYSSKAEGRFTAIFELNLQNLSQDEHFVNVVSREKGY